MNKSILLSLIVFLIHTVSYASVALADEVPVTWQNIVGAINVNNDLTKTTPQGWGTSGASSVESLLSGDGYVTTIVDETDSFRMIGLSNGDSNQSFTDGDFFIYPTSGALQIYEGGTKKGHFGAYSTGDTLKIAVESGVVNYYQNDILLYTSLQTLVYPLLVDTALYSTGATLKEVKLGGVNWVMPDITPSIPILTTQSATVLSSPITITGTGDVDSTIKLYVNDPALVVDLDSVIVDSSGNFSFNGVDIYPGNNVIRVTATVGINTSAPSSVVITLDTTPQISIPILTTQSATVLSSPITITGTGDAFSTIELFKESTSLGTVTVDADGNFSFPGVVLSSVNTFYATATDGINTTTFSNFVTIFLDNSPPSPPIITTPSATVLSSPITIDGIGDASSTIELFNGTASLGTVTADADRFFSFTEVELEPGDNSFTATATVGNNTSPVSSPSVVITLDTTPPVVPTTEKKKSGGGCGDCIPPTFGKDKNHKQVVKGGFSFNGDTTDVTEYWTPYQMITAQTNSTHNFTLKAYENQGVHNIKWFQFGVVSEVGTPISDAEVLATIHIQSSEIEKIVERDPNNLFDIVNATSYVESCGYTTSDCLEISLDVMFRDDLKNKVIVIQAMDNSRNADTKFLNEGIETVGDSLNEPLISHVTVSKGGAFYPQDRGVVELTLTSYKDNAWQDEYGYMWSANNYGFYIVDSVPVPLREPDVPWLSMNRMHSDFYKIQDYEVKRATEKLLELCPDCLDSFTDFNDSWTYELPEEYDRIKKISHLIDIEKIKAQKVLDGVKPIFIYN